jgi:hypothetical protein
LIGSNASFIIWTINVSFVSGLGRKFIITATLSSKTKKEPAVVALPLVVHEDTIEFSCARGPMVHLFGSELEVFMMDKIFQWMRVILNKVAHVRGVNIMVEKLPGHFNLKISSPVLCSRK